MYNVKIDESIIGKALIEVLQDEIKVSYLIKRQFSSINFFLFLSFLVLNKSLLAKENTTREQATRCSAAAHLGLLSPKNVPSTFLPTKVI